MIAIFPRQARDRHRESHSKYNNGGRLNLPRQAQDKHAPLASKNSQKSARVGLLDWTQCSRSSAMERLEESSSVCEDTVFLSHLYINTNFLPRQARDKHRENSETTTVFSGVMLKAWKHQPTWEKRGLVPSKTAPARGGGCELAFDEYLPRPIYSCDISEIQTGWSPRPERPV